MSSYQNTVATVALCTVVLLACVSGSDATTPSFKMANVTAYTQLKTSNASTLYAVNTTGYDTPIYLIDLSGSRTQIGYDYGIMVAPWIEANYKALLGFILGTSLKAEAEQAILGLFMDWQWDKYLSQQCPDEYLQEIAGITTAGHEVGIPDLGRYVSRGIALANMPGDTGDFLQVLMSEFMAHFNITAEQKKTLTTALAHVKGHDCSMFSIWGGRTVNGDLFSARNLDWEANTGLNKYKLVTVYRPTGAIPHASIGYAALWGALAGLSQAGLSVHEANLEEKPETWLGFPWVLRLRYIMENAKDLSSAQKLWAATNNTVGFNHMVTSASDNHAGQTSHPAMVFETMKDYTAYFQDNDAREQQATFTDPKTESSWQIGYPMPEALYRTNNGFDPKVMSNYVWNLAAGAGNDSEYRYQLIRNAFATYEVQGKKVGVVEAINVTSIAGSNGPSYPKGDFFTCNPANYPHANNVLSITFQPGSQTFYGAWETGSGSNWIPACCSTYVTFDMTPWFAGKGPVMPGSRASPRKTRARPSTKAATAAVSFDLADRVKITPK
eukprot:TRINITY_DN4578_c0_g2_i1.p1 TRINITY_DN4578_c0_g2~~TRINITY_DN4578_c0_g2_i1.p1  ORF type:complete len:554 (+),score=148.91 TRINITY_DN4578_c0_g2_i1:61-1722(+)